MSNSNFDNNEVDSFRFHWLQDVNLIVNTFDIYFGCFFSDANFHHFAAKIFKFWIYKEYNPLNHCIISWKEDFYP